MERDASFGSLAGQPEQLVVVEAARYTELLISRRHLERVGDDPFRLHDVDTDETFVMRAGSEAGIAKGA